MKLKTLSIYLVCALSLTSCSLALPRGEYDSTYWDSKAAECLSTGGIVGQAGTSVGRYIGDRLIFDYDGYCYMDFRGKVPLNSL